MITKEIIRKFDVPGPRYTSYPTAPVWNESVSQSVYRRKLNSLGQTDKTLSLYFHIPFCQSLCSFCACNVVIRPQEDKYGDQYLDYLNKEIDIVKKELGSRMKVKQLHLGGGTPNFLSAKQITQLINTVKKNFEITRDAEVAIEIDPRTIDKLKIDLLKELGFNRISMGVQDFNQQVQEAINRVQPFELVKDVYDYCRKKGFSSVNFDLIYGLPFQTLKSFEDTVKKVSELKPDRIALYSFAYVPWLKHHQNKIDPKTLPLQDEKLDIFLRARDIFLNEGYCAIAMDHFALENDELSQSFKKGILHRNFMGYTVKPADEYLGLGLTSIGFMQKTFIQNHKVLKDYFAALDRNELPVERGKELTEDDQIRQWTINQLMCQFSLNKETFKALFKMSFEDYFSDEGEHIEYCQSEGLLRSIGNQITITELGKIFIRNICMGFDAYLKGKEAPAKFSRTV